IPHKKGILSMARTSDPDSAGSQFFIVTRDSQFLDNQYTVFGRVIEGLDIVDKIASESTNQNDQPTNPEDARIKKVIIKDR
ncbi:MAG: peptidylprolyl isomerase, partial [Nitrososphaeraceae archaeon]|nr:peptidylprolyl isomerase [Nitrososphaeraceae archaeon]